MLLCSLKCALTGRKDRILKHLYNKVYHENKANKL